MRAARILDFFEKLLFAFVFEFKVEFRLFWWSMTVLGGVFRGLVVWIGSQGRNDTASLRLNL